MEKKFFHKTIGEPKQRNSLALALGITLVVVIVVLLGLIALTGSHWKEVRFAFQHPTFVNELRMVYEHEHQQADENVLLRQRMEIQTTNSHELVPEAGEAAEPEKKD